VCLHEVHNLTEFTTDILRSLSPKWPLSRMRPSLHSRLQTSSLLGNYFYKTSIRNFMKIRHTVQSVIKWHGRTGGCSLHISGVFPSRFHTEVPRAIFFRCQTKTEKQQEIDPINETGCEMWNLFDWHRVG